MSDATLEWARVEYQPDLHTPHGQPVPLGIVLLYRSPRVNAVVVIGREPRRGASPPPELRDVGTLGHAQLQSWVSALGKDAQEALLEQRPNPFGALASRWRMNLYVTDPEPVQPPAAESDESFTTDLMQLGQRLYQDFVKEPFQGLPSLPGPFGRRTKMDWITSQLEALAAT